MAKFKVNYVFSITGYGTALLGEITEGEIGWGHKIHLIINGDQSILIINSIEAVRSNNMAEIGLVLTLPEGVVKDDLLSFIGQTISISHD